MTVADLERRTDPARARPVLLSGIEALVQLIVGQAGLDARRGWRTETFVSGYEGSPLGGLDMALQRECRRGGHPGVHHAPGLNEELGATAVGGSQSVPRPSARLDGVVGFWYGKAPGLDRSGDAIRHANYMGVAPRGGVLAITGDDPAAKSSTLPSASEVALAELCLPVLYPASTQDVIDLGRHGVEISRYSGLWVGFKVVTEVADGFGTAHLDPDPAGMVVPELEIDGRRWVHHQRLVSLPPESLEAEHDIFYGRLAAAEAYAAANHLNQVTTAPRDAWLGIVAAGTAYQSLRQSLHDLGLDDADLDHYGIRLLKLGMIYPLERGIVRDFARGLEEILVIEEKRPFLEAALRDILYQGPDQPAVLGKTDRSGKALVPADGGLTPGRIAPCLLRVLSRRLPSLGASPPRRRIPVTGTSPAGPSAAGGGGSAAVQRVPFFCSGCPHNRSTVAPEGSVIGAGIGCHTMVQLSTETNRRGHALTQMGGEGAQWIGQAPFSEASHMFQNIGDGTLFHSGTLAIRAGVAAGIDITYKILYNRAVAMTGGQAPVGGLEVPQLAQTLSAEGVSRIIVCADDPHKYPRRAGWPRGTQVWPRHRLDEAQLQLQSTPGVSVLIYDQQCAAEARRLRKRGEQAEPMRRVVINLAVCEGCGDCGAKSNCLSVQPVETEYGRKTQIHQSSCNKDYSCLDGDCPSFVTLTPKKGRRSAGRGAVAGAGPAAAAEPVGDPPGEPAAKAVVGDGYNLYLSGIGGTGIVTVNRLLATAAVSEGLHVEGLDQTGLSQKAGPVVSHLKFSALDQGHSRRVGVGDADCLLVFDALVAGDSRALAVASPERTVAVVSTSAVPTGTMVRDPGLEYPAQSSLRAVLDGVTRPGLSFYLDALGVSEALFGSDLSANILLLGAAYQRGVIPLSAGSIEAAIATGGLAVEANTAAFRWGRILVADPDRLEAARPGASGHGAGARSPRRRRRQRVLAVSGGLDGEVGRLADLRAAELVAYQGPALARDYLAGVRRVAEAEARAVPGRHELSEAVARYLFKLMAYKDEYEVARLYLDPSFEATRVGAFPGGARIRYQLHPPLLRYLGRKRKVGFGSWFKVVFRLLYALRFLRGRALDPFGHTRVRRTERALIEEYKSLVELALDHLSGESYDAAVRLARLADMVRGYEEIKLANVERYRATVSLALEDLSATRRVS